MEIKKLLNIKHFKNLTLMFIRLIGRFRERVKIDVIVILNLKFTMYCNTFSRIDFPRFSNSNRISCKWKSKKD